MLSCGCSGTLGTRSTGGKKWYSPLFGKRSKTFFSRSTLTLGEGNGKKNTNYAGYPIKEGILDWHITVYLVSLIPYPIIYSIFVSSWTNFGCSEHFSYPLLPRPKLRDGSLIWIRLHLLAAFTLTNERSTPSLNRREPLYDTKSSPVININPARGRQRTRTNPDYEEKESLKAKFDYDTSFQELLALKGAYPGTKGRLLRLEQGPKE